MSSVLLSSTHEFTKLARTGKIVDKSSAIVDFLRDDYPVHLLLRPRRSGKSTLLTMFQAFFELGDSATLEERKALFLDNNLAITNNKKCMEQFGMYPVLYIDLSIIATTLGDLKGEFQKLVKTVVLDLLERGLLTNLHELHETSRTFVNQVVNRELPADEWPESLSKLTDILYTLHKREVIVLIDEYDTPTAHATRYGYFDEANLFFRQVFSPLLKTNKHCRGTLIVGILRVAKAGWLSGVNNLNVYILGQPGLYSTACMFTEAETQLLYKEQKKTLESCDSEITFTFEDLSKWYNGYDSGDGQRLYNPWSIARALGGNKLNRYWAESGYDRAIIKRIHRMLKSDHQFRKQIEGLLMHEPVAIELDEEVTYSSIASLSRRQLWTFLYSAGYLTRWMVETQHLRDTSGDIDASSGDITDSDDDWDMDTGNVKSTRNRDGSEGSDSSSGDLKDIIRVQIPNFEIRSVFCQWLLDHYVDFVKSDNSSYIEMFQHMVSGSMALFAKGFSKLIWVTMPSQFLGSKECVYQAYVCAFMTAVGKGAGGWDFQMERSSGRGLDLFLLCDDEAVIQEHNRIAMTKKDKGSSYGDSQRMRLTKEAENGFSQIEARGYRARLPDRVTKLREFGIAFLGPYCAIVGRSLKRQPGGLWEFEKSYPTKRNERHRSKLYTVSA